MLHDFCSELLTLTLARLLPLRFRFDSDLFDSNETLLTLLLLTPDVAEAFPFVLLFCKTEDELSDAIDDEEEWLKLDEMLRLKAPILLEPMLLLMAASAHSSNTSPTSLSAGEAHLALVST
jgi:hypothetical protein